MKKAIIVVLLVAAICAFAGAENLKDTRVSQGISSKSTLTKQGLRAASKTKSVKKYWRKMTTFVKGKVSSVLKKVEVAFVKLKGKAKARLEALKKKNKGSKGYVLKLPYSQHAVMGTNVYVAAHPINCGIVYEGQGEEIADEECVNLLETYEEPEAEEEKTEFLEVGMPVTSSHTGCNAKEIFGPGKIPSKCSGKDESIEWVADPSFAACVESIHEARVSVQFTNENTQDGLKLWWDKDHLFADITCAAPKSRRRLLQAGNNNAQS
jgi:hypothetical protein